MPMPPQRTPQAGAGTELPGQIAAYRQKLAAGQADKVRRDWLEWHIRRVRKRMVDVEARLGALAAE